MNINLSDNAEKLLKDLLDIDPKDGQIPCFDAFIEGGTDYRQYAKELEQHHLISHLEFFGRKYLRCSITPQGKEYFQNKLQNKKKDTNVDKSTNISTDGDNNVTYYVTGHGSVNHNTSSPTEKKGNGKTIAIISIFITLLIGVGTLLFMWQSNRIAESHLGIEEKRYSTETTPYFSFEEKKFADGTYGWEIIPNKDIVSTAEVALKCYIFYNDNNKDTEEVTKFARLFDLTDNYGYQFGSLASSYEIHYLDSPATMYLASKENRSEFLHLLEEKIKDKYDESFPVGFLVEIKIYYTVYEGKGTKESDVQYFMYDENMMIEHFQINKAVQPVMVDSLFATDGEGIFLDSNDSLDDLLSKATNAYFP